MVDEAIQDLTWLYSQGPSGKRNSKKMGGNVRLHPLESASPIVTHSANSLTRRRNLSDVHYVSHLQHRAANVNRQPVAPQKKSPTKLSNLSTEDIAQHIEEVQLHVLQESEILKKITSTITVQYSALDEVAKTILTHRKELAAKIEEINQNYVDLFEHMLSEIMRIQRAKFKVSCKIVISSYKYCFAKPTTHACLFT
ncbi:hypothetical protein EON65_24460 [archaeon]|nr:MAG: hypothetical protein EON65_24460 [archaeon]